MVTLDHLIWLKRSSHHAIATVFFTYFAFANRTGIFALEPGCDTLCMESVQTGQDYVLLVDLVLALANGTLLVFF